MESAPLIRAQEHVRNASSATYAGDLARAGQEHELAAAAFREGLSCTKNAEALRLLAILENNHRTHARRIKTDPRKEKTKEKDATFTEAAEPATTPSPQKSTVARPTSPPTSATSPTRAPSRRRLPQSSIASNLAEARGIGPRRGTPTNAAVSVTNALGNRHEQASAPVRDMLSRKAEANKRNDTSRPRKQEGNESSPPNQSISSNNDDSFKRFYAAFGSVMSAITPQLALTSLPLTLSPPAPVTEPPPESKRGKSESKSRNQSPEASRTVKSSEPDLTALISKAALRALREDGSAPLGPNESFYLVPTSGGTASYANILQNPNAPHHPHHAAQNPQLASIDEGDNETGGLRGSSHEEFVDAHETVGPPSPTISRRPRSRGNSAVTAVRSIPAGRGSGLKTFEEISLENETLKATVDKQAKRLSMWETTSQSSYNALAQSFRARKMPSDPTALAQALAMGANAVPPALPLPSISQPDPDVAKRLAELEAQAAERNARLEQMAKDNERLERENKKNSEVLGRYRDQWEKLKAGARKRDIEKRAARLKAGNGGEAAKESETGEEEEVDGVEAEEPGLGKA